MKLFRIFIIYSFCCTSPLALCTEINSEKIRFVQYMMSKGASIHTIWKPEYNECYSEAMFDALNLEEIKFLMFFIDTDEQNSNKLDSEIEQIAVSTYKFKGIYKDSMNKKWARLEGDRIEKCKHLE